MRGWRGGGGGHLWRRRMVLVLSYMRLREKRKYTSRWSWEIVTVCKLQHYRWHVYVWHDSFICVTWLIHMWHDSFICDMSHSFWRFASYCITGDMTQSHLCHDSFTCDMTRSYVTRLVHMWHDWFICDMTYSHVTWLIHMWHDSFICDMTYSLVSWLIHD